MQALERRIANLQRMASSAQSSAGDNEGSVALAAQRAEYEARLGKLERLLAARDSELQGAQELFATSPESHLPMFDCMSAQSAACCSRGQLIV